KYYLESKLGVGGMGTVYRAGRLLIGDRVAVKVLHPDQMADPQAVERFRREAQTAARLKHPNVVTVYDFGVSREGLNYQVMELAEGESLRSWSSDMAGWLRPQPPRLSVRSARRWTRRTGRVLFIATSNRRTFSCRQSQAACRSRCSIS